MAKSKSVANEALRSEIFGKSIYLDTQLGLQAQTEARSWLGGAPKIPLDVAWPTVQIDDDGAEGKRRALSHLAQICLGDLEADVWHGLGSRTGWLVFFCDPNDGEVQTVKVIHTETLGPERTPPPSETQAVPATRRRVALKVLNEGEIKELDAARNKTAKRPFPYSDAERDDYQPFDWPTALKYMECINALFSTQSVKTTKQFSNFLLQGNIASYPLKRRLETIKRRRWRARRELAVIEAIRSGDWSRVEGPLPGMHLHLTESHVEHHIKAYNECKMSFLEEVKATLGIRPPNLKKQIRLYRQTLTNRKNVAGKVDDLSRRLFELNSLNVPFDEKAYKIIKEINDLDAPFFEWTADGVPIIKIKKLRTAYLFAYADFVFDYVLNQIISGDAFESSAPSSLFEHVAAKSAAKSPLVPRKMGGYPDLQQEDGLMLFDNEAARKGSAENLLLLQLPSDRLVSDSDFGTQYFAIAAKDLEANNFSKITSFIQSD